MVPCPQCRRHLLTLSLPCPFCAAPAAGRVGAAVMTVLTPLVLAACYGTGDKYYDTYDTGPEPVDMDEDGYTSDMDCNDEDAAINPGATEVCDDTIDNDCDESIDADDEDCQTR